MNKSFFIKKCPLPLMLFVLSGICGLFAGCTGLSDYSQESLFPSENITTVYIEMFDNRTFWRGVEYELTDALAKRIEVETPYKVVSSRERADTVITGQITSVSRPILSTERETGRALEKEVEISAVVNWKNFKTGQLFLDNRTISASASYSEWQQQNFDYASTLAANNLAKKIVELMEKPW